MPHKHTFSSTSILQAPSAYHSRSQSLAENVHGPRSRPSDSGLSISDSSSRVAAAPASPARRPVDRMGGKRADGLSVSTTKCTPSPRTVRFQLDEHPERAARARGLSQIRDFAFPAEGDVGLARANDIESDRLSTRGKWSLEDNPVEDLSPGGFDRVLGDEDVLIDEGSISARRGGPNLSIDPGGGDSYANRWRRAEMLEAGRHTALDGHQILCGFCDRMSGGSDMRILIVLIICVVALFMLAMMDLALGHTPHS